MIEDSESSALPLGELREYMYLLFYLKYSIIKEIIIKNILWMKFHFT